MKQLTKQSSEAEIKAYFCAVLHLSESDEEFPVNLDDVWPLVYSRKDKAVRALQSNDLFIKGIDYQVLPQNGENSKALPQNGGKLKEGRPVDIYMLSVPCLEFFIARKVRPVFEVYRKVFHKVAEGNAIPPHPFDITEPIGLEETLQPLSDYMHQVNDRWERLEMDVVGQRGRNDVILMYNEWVTTYRSMIAQLSQLVQYETINKIEGAYFI
nr:MAG TPA: hypothetical protein [Caudoviricetes sp.]